MGTVGEQQPHRSLVSALCGNNQGKFSLKINVNTSTGCHYQVYYSLETKFGCNLEALVSEILPPPPTKMVS
jgi:hypothetical protein